MVRGDAGRAFGSPRGPLTSIGDLLLALYHQTLPEDGFGAGNGSFRWPTVTIGRDRWAEATETRLRGGQALELVAVRQQRWLRDGEGVELVAARQQG